jgi:hypothetical protein
MSADRFRFIAVLIAFACTWLVLDAPASAEKDDCSVWSKCTLTSCVWNLDPLPDDPIPHPSCYFSNFCLGGGCCECTYTGVQ